MLNQVLELSSGTCHQFVEDAVKISKPFWIFNFHKYCIISWKSLRCIQREFSYKSTGERILKISLHLPKLLSNIVGYTFLRDSVGIGYSIFGSGITTIWSFFSGVSYRTLTCSIHCLER